MVTAYTQPKGKDPEFDAFQAKYDYTRSNLTADADMRRKKADEDYQAALASLEQQGTYSRRNLDTNMMSRGIFRSGETNRRRGELESTLLQGRSAADTSKANMDGQVSSDLQRAMTGLDLDWEQARSSALSRMSSDGGGGGGGPTAPFAPMPPLPPYQMPGLQSPSTSWWNVGAQKPKPKLAPVNPPKLRLT